MNGITWLGHDSFRIVGKKKVYVDPFRLKDAKKDADIILITHEHYDHCSIRDIMAISSNKTSILIPPDCQSKLNDFPGKIILIEPNKKYNVQTIEIQTIPAYNINKPFHPKENGWVGYIFKLNDLFYYHAGDTDLIEEMNQLSPSKIQIEFAFLPVSGTYVMNAIEAAKAVEIIKPRYAIPMHYGSIVGTRSDADKFKELCSNSNSQTEVIVPEKRT